jgi:hypothetical protein
MTRSTGDRGAPRRKERLPQKANFSTEAEFLRLRPGSRGPDNLVKGQLLGKLGPRGYGRLLDQLRKAVAR